jgi:shikimate kinase
VKKHVVLVGLPGAGKTTVGQLVADQLGARFVDIDVSVAQRAGLSVVRIFAERGEPVFRELEKAEVDQELAGSPGVLAPGGGWAVQPGSLEGVSGRALTIYLRISASEAAKRIIAAGGGRPLVGTQDPTGTLKELLGTRQSFYERCHVTVEAGATPPETVRAAVVKLARSLGGW